MRTADQALYQAKRAGRDQVVVAEQDEGMDFPGSAGRVTEQHSLGSGSHAVNGILSTVTQLESCDGAESKLPLL